MRKPLEVFALDEMMNRATGSIPYKSLIWTRRYHECGQFQMTVPANVYDPSWAYVYADLRPETGIIQKVEYSDSSTVAGGVDTVTVSGFFLECLLNRVTFLVEQPEEKTIEIHVPRPKSPGIRRADMPTVYRDPDTGDYFYENSSGDLVDQQGNRVDGSSSWEEVHTEFLGQTKLNEEWGYLPNDMMSSNYNYKVDGEDGTIHLNSWWGSEKTYDIVMEDDKGNVYYYPTTSLDGEKVIHIANSVATLDQTRGYKTRKRAWDASGGVRYETITVKGPWQRTDTMEPITESDSVDQLFKWIQVFCGSTFKYEEPGIEGVVKTLDPSLQYLGDFAYSVLKEVEASFRVVYGFVNNTMVFEVYRGLDRTQDQEADENPWTVFSDTWGTIKGYSASRDDSNYRNVCYVLYSYDQPTSFESDGTPHLEEITEVQGDGTTKVLGWEVPYETKRGYQTARVEDDVEGDRECYLDLRDEGDGAPSCDSQWSRDQYRYDESQPNNGKPTFEPMRDFYEQWPDALTQRGVVELEQNHGVVTNLDTGTVNTDGYMVDWDLGDKVDFGVSTVGLADVARITEVEEVYESTGTGVRNEIHITVGERLLTTYDKLRGEK